MDMGDHCTLLECNVLTFLPVTCAYCRGLYCQSHFLPLQHACKAPGAAEADRTLSDTEILKRLQRANVRRKDVQGTSDAIGGVSLRSDGYDEETSRLPCQLKGCKRFSLQLDQQTSRSAAEIGKLSVNKSDGKYGQRSFTHAAPRCERCRGFYCMTHRSALAHKCARPALPTQGDQKREAAEERKRKAKEILQKHFPNRIVK